MSPIDPAIIENVRAAMTISVLTGAGISAESGIPTFRDAMTGFLGGVRRKHNIAPSTERI